MEGFLEKKKAEFKGELLRPQCIIGEILVGSHGV